MTSGDEEHDDPSKTGQEGQPVQNEEPSWRIFSDDEVAHGEHHGVAGEDVVAAVDVLPVDA